MWLPTSRAFLLWIPSWIWIRRRTDGSGQGTRSRYCDGSRCTRLVTGLGLAIAKQIVEMHGVRRQLFVFGFLPRTASTCASSAQVFRGKMDRARPTLPPDSGQSPIRLKNAPCQADFACGAGASPSVGHPIWTRHAPEVLNQLLHLPGFVTLVLRRYGSHTDCLNWCN